MPAVTWKIRYISTTLDCLPDSTTQLYNPHPILAKIPLKNSRKKSVIYYSFYNVSLEQKGREKM